MENIQYVIVVDIMVADVPMINECDLVKLQRRFIRSESGGRSRLPDQEDYKAL